ESLRPGKDSVNHPYRQSVPKHDSSDADGASQTRIQTKYRYAVRVAGSDQNSRQREVGSGNSLRRCSERRTRERPVQASSYFRTCNGREDLPHLSQEPPALDQRRGISQSTSTMAR